MYVLYLLTVHLHFKYTIHKSKFLLGPLIDDHSRIVLKTFTASEGDYINANYIEVRIDKEHDKNNSLVYMKRLTNQ